MRVLIRADSNERIGIGHVMRGLALAQAVTDAGGEARFLKAPGPSLLDHRLAREGFLVDFLSAEPGSPEDAEETAARARASGATWVVADGYHLDAHYQERVREGGPRLLVVDDHAHAGRYSADLLLNQNIDASETMYRRRADGARLLLGTKYALLRREFFGWRELPRETPARARRVLVTFGGSDPVGATEKALEALRVMGNADLDVTCLAGAGNPRGAALRKAVAGLPFPIRLAQDAHDVPERMALSDLAVSAAGSTCWELAFLGVPALVLVLADNQAGIAAGLAREGAVRNLGWHHDLTAEALASALAALLADQTARRTMSERGRALVDGRGAARVVAAMHEMSGG